MLKMILDSTIDRVRKRASEGDCPVTPPFSVEHLETALLTLAGQSFENAHPDDLAVDRFAAAMKAKLAEKRAQGRGGWENKDECSAEFLSKLMRGHVEKGDPVDVGNFAMMLHQRGEGIVPAPSDQSDTERMRAAVLLAADTFQRYADLHRVKGTSDGLSKAETNAALARQMRAALAEKEAGQ